MLGCAFGHMRIRVTAQPSSPLILNRARSMCCGAIFVGAGSITFHRPKNCAIPSHFAHYSQRPTAKRFAAIRLSAIVCLGPEHFSWKNIALAHVGRLYSDQGL